MGILIVLSIALVAIFAFYWMTVGAFRLLTRLLGLPKYRDVIVPSKYDFKTVVEFDNPVAQYAYDVMAGFKHDTFTKLELAGYFCFAGLFIAASVKWVFVILVVLLWYWLWLSPSAMRATRWRAKTFKDCTADDWHKTHLWAMESELRQQEITSAIRRSGIHFH